MKANVGKVLLRPGVLLGLLLLLAVPGVPRAWAFDGRSGDQIVIGAGDTINDDLYVAANSVTIDGTVKGDVFAAARVVTINGTVEGSLNAVAQAVIIRGSVRDTVRVGGQAMLVEGNARIGRDLVFGGYSVETRAGTAVGRDAIVGGNQALLAGNVERNVRGGMVGLELAGTVGGDVDVQVSSQGTTTNYGMTPPPEIGIPSVPTGLTVTEGAKVNGKLTYTSREQYGLRGLVAGGVVYQKEQVPETPVPGFGAAVLDNLRRLIALVLVGLLLIWVAPRFTRHIADTVEARPLASFGWGLVGFFAFVAATIVIAIAMIALAIAFGLMTLGNLTGLVLMLGIAGDASLVVAFIVFTSYVAQAAVGYLGGRWILERVLPSWTAYRVVPLLVGLVLFVLVTAIPFLGGIIGLIVTAFGLGAAWIWAMDGLRRQPAAPAVGPAGVPAPAV